MEGWGQNARREILAHTFQQAADLPSDHLARRNGMEPSTQKAASANEVCQIAA